MTPARDPKQVENHEKLLFSSLLISIIELLPKGSENFEIEFPFSDNFFSTTISIFFPTSNWLVLAYFLYLFTILKISLSFI